MYNQLCLISIFCVLSDQRDITQSLSIILEKKEKNTYEIDNDALPLSR